MSGMVAMILHTLTLRAFIRTIMREAKHRRKNIILHTWRSSPKGRYPSVVSGLMIAGVTGYGYHHIVAWELGRRLPTLEQALRVLGAVREWAV